MTVGAPCVGQLGSLLDFIIALCLAGFIYVATALWRACLCGQSNQAIVNKSDARPSGEVNMPAISHTHTHGYGKYFAGFLVALALAVLALPIARVAIVLPMWFVSDERWAYIPNTETLGLHLISLVCSGVAFGLVARAQRLRMPAIVSYALYCCACASLKLRRTSE